MVTRDPVPSAQPDLPAFEAVSAALRETQAQLTAALEAARMAIWRRDVQGGGTTATDSMAALWGLLPEQTFAAHAQEYQLVHPDDRSRHLALVRRALRTSGSWHAVFRAIRPRDGRIAWLEERGRVYRDPRNGGRVIEGLLYDITERKLAEEVLRELAARKEFLLQVQDALSPLADPIRIQFEAARILRDHLGADRVYYNDSQAGAAPPGSREPEAGGDLPYLVTDTGLSHSLPGEARAAYEALGIHACASATVMKEGRPVWTLNVVSRTAREWTAGELALIREVAERTWAAVERARAETLLRTSEERFREFAAASTDALWIRSARTLKFEFTSGAFSDVYGTSVEQIAGHKNHLRRWMRLVVPEDRSRVFAALKRASSGERVIHEFRITRPSDGRVRWIRSTNFPLPGPSGRLEYFGGIGRDYTEEKEASRRTQVLITELQHRTRNQIAVVRSLSNKTLDESESLLRYRERFDERLAAMSRAQRLLSRLADGERVSFDELLQAELLAHGAVAQRLSLEGPPDIGLRSSTVQTLSLAIHELATNAVKYGALSSPDGHLEIKWCVRQAEDGKSPTLNVSWLETGVRVADAATAERHRGYGRQLIEHALPYQLKARTFYEMGPEHVRCVIDVPLAGSIRTHET